MPPANKPKPKKLLIVVNVAWFFISHRLPLAVAAREAGYEVHVAAGGATASERMLIVDHGIQFHSLKVARSDRSPTAIINFAAQLVRLYQRVKPDVVHHVTIKPVMLGTLAARVAQVPYVVNAVSGLGYSFSSDRAARTGFRRLVGVAYRFCLGHPRMTVIFQNRDDERDFLSWTHLRDIRSVQIPGSGVDLKVFRATHEPVDVLTTICLPARMLRDKGVIEFAHAVSILKSKGLRVEGVLAGAPDPDNPESLTETELRALERDYGVIWIGQVGDVPELFAKSNIVCLPSYREGLPKALIEASAAARAIVTTDVPGCRHVVENEVTGLLVPAKDSVSLADALERLVRDSTLRTRLATAARARAEREFDVGLIVKKTLSLYSQPA